MTHHEVTLYLSVIHANTSQEFAFEIYLIFIKDYMKIVYNLDNNTIKDFLVLNNQIIYTNFQ